MKHPLTKHCLITVFILAASYATCQEAQKPSIEDAQSVTSRWENWRKGLAGDDKILIDKLDTLQASFEQSTVILGRLAQASVSPSTKEMVISFHGGYHLTECLLHGLYRMEQMNLWTTENEKAADLNAFTIVPFYMNFLHHAQDVHGSLPMLRRLDASTEYQGFINRLDSELRDARRFCWDRAHKLSPEISKMNVRQYALRQP